MTNSETGDNGNENSTPPQNSTAQPNPGATPEEAANMQQQDLNNAGATQANVDQALNAYELENNQNQTPEAQATIILTGAMYGGKKEIPIQPGQTLNEALKAANAKTPTKFSYRDDAGKEVDLNKHIVQPGMILSTVEKTKAG